MTYRQPTTPPLVITLRKLIIAVDPEHGTALWQQPLAAPARRLFVVERSLFVALGNVTAGTVLCFDLYTGQPRGSVSVGFRPSAGLVRDGRLYLAGQDGAACLSVEGIVLWRAKVELQSTGILSAESMVTFYNGAGQELWKAPVGMTSSADNVGLALGELWAQPDLRD